MHTVAVQQQITTTEPMNKKSCMEGLHLHGEN